jgi:6-phosphogluconolactonase (cycloisomerase 2 family)
MMQHLQHEFYLKLEEYVVKTQQGARNMVLEPSEFVAYTLSDLV